MKKILVTGDGYTSDHFSRLNAAGFEVVHRPHDLPPDEFRNLLLLADAHILGGSERMTVTELAVAPRLRLISFVGTGAGTFIDMADAALRGIVVTNTPGIMAAAVAEHTLGMILGLRRRLFVGNEAVKASTSTAQVSDELSAATIGIVGMGAIGSRVATILRRSFYSDVFYYNRSRKPDLEQEIGIIPIDLVALFERCDVIILLIPISDETRHLVNRGLLQAAKRKPILINTAGASLVDPYALREALADGFIATAAFDGYYIEPPPHVDADPYQLLSLSDERFVMTPHTAAKTRQSWARMVDLAVENAIRLFPTGR